MNSAKVLADILAHKKMIERLARKLKVAQDELRFEAPDRAARLDAADATLLAEAEALAKEPPF